MRRLEKSDWNNQILMEEVTGYYVGNLRDFAAARS
jgi:hypothetical protein